VSINLPDLNQENALSPIVPPPSFEATNGWYLPPGHKLLLDVEDEALLLSTQAKLPFSRITHESSRLSPTSPTANLMVFHILELLYGVPIAVSVSVNPSASIFG